MLPTSTLEIQEKSLPISKLLLFLDDLDLYSSRLLDELLTVHDNYAIVVLINLNTEEVTHSILH